MEARRESLGVAARTSPQCVVLAQSLEMLVSSLGGDRESVGDAIYGALTSSLLCIKEGNGQKLFSRERLSEGFF